MTIYARSLEANTSDRNVVRRARPADIPAIIELGLEGLRQGAYENMVISREKVETLARDCVTAARNFSCVSECDGVVVAALCAVVHECLCYERSQASVIQFFSRKRGAGLPLIREFLRWARGRPAIKMIAFSIEYDADPRIGMFLERIGLTKKLPSYVETR